MMRLGMRGLAIMALLVPCLMSQGDASPTGSCRLVQRASPSRISGGRRQARTQETRFLALRGGGSALGSDGDAITEEQAGEELIKAAVEANIDGLDPAGLNLLVQAGAPVNYQDMWKRTPLHYAAREGQLAAITRLVELGGDLTAQDFLARTPLHLAARKGHADAVVLLTELGSDINHPDKNPWPNNSGRTALHWACYKGHPEVVWRLCEQGADLEAKDAMARTPLHWAGRRGQADCCQVLLVMGADPQAVDSKNMKAINLANSKESNAATQALLHTATIRGTLPTDLPAFAPSAQPNQAAPQGRPLGGGGGVASAVGLAAKARLGSAVARAKPAQPAEPVVLSAEAQGWEEEEQEEEAGGEEAYEPEPYGGTAEDPDAEGEEAPDEMHAAIARAQALYASGSGAAAGGWEQDAQGDEDDEGVEYA